MHGGVGESGAGSFRYDYNYFYIWREVQGGLLGRILSDDSYLVHPRVLLERRRLPLPPPLTELMMLWTQGTVGPWGITPLS